MLTAKVTAGSSPAWTNIIRKLDQVRFTGGNGMAAPRGPALASCTAGGLKRFTS